MREEDIKNIKEGERWAIITYFASGDENSYVAGNTLAGLQQEIDWNRQIGITYEVFYEDELRRGKA